jgi:phospholipid-binding lipoprotein MlaA
LEDRESSSSEARQLLAAPVQFVAARPRSAKLLRLSPKKAEQFRCVHKKGFGLVSQIATGFAAAALAALVLTGCTAGPPGPDNDPYETFNRQVFAFNMRLDKAVARPVAKGYNAAVPEPARTGVHNVLGNLGEPVVFANLVLQGKLGDAGGTLVRFVLDSSAGIGGLIDVGARTGLPAKDADFGITLGVWGAGEGPYLMLPLIGPAPPRDLAGRGVDTFFDPVTYVDFRSKFAYEGGRAVLEIIDIRARNLDTLDDIERTSIDFYAASRSLYLQHRAAEVRGSAPDAMPDATPADPAP